VLAAGTVTAAGAENVEVIPKPAPKPDAFQYAAAGAAIEIAIADRQTHMKAARGKWILIRTPALHRGMRTPLPAKVQTVGTTSWVVPRSDTTHERRG
jgi:hypothetical protein